jgi:3-oxoacyl-[acyl-carrier-protein] synthase-3
VGLARRALVVGSEALSKLTNWHDRGTCVLFGDGAGAAVLERVEDGGFLGFELGSDGSGGPDLCAPAGGSRAPASADTVEQELHYLHMNGREVFKFAPRAMVAAAERLLEECGLAVEDIDLYVPHQANKRIIDHAVRHLHLPPEKVRINVDRYGNTSSASIPIALYEAMADGALADGMTVLMTAVGAGFSWGSTLLVWGNGR